jgi:hypothetical protein
LKATVDAICSHGMCTHPLLGRVAPYCLDLVFGLVGVVGVGDTPAPVCGRDGDTDDGVGVRGSLPRGIGLNAGWT